MNRENRIETKIPVMTLVLVLINVAVYLYVEFSGSSYDTEYMIQMGAVYDPLVGQESGFFA